MPRFINYNYRQMKMLPISYDKRKCLPLRQFHVLIGTIPERNTGVIERMKQKIDSDQGRAIYSQRLGTVEPVFANITHMIGIKRFSLRGKEKVNTQWQWMTMVHHIFKLHRFAWI